jgi:hypothetical protein
MRRFKFLGLALLSVCAFGIMTAASASAALPDLSLLSGEAFPVTMEGSLTSKDLLETAVLGEKLEGTKVTLKLELAELSALGKFTAVFVGVKEKTNPCKSTSGAKEEVATSGEFHIVLLVGGASYGIVFLPSSVLIECGEPAKTKIHVKGAAVGSTTLATGADFTETKGTLEGSKGKNNITEYLNSSGTATKGILESNFGTGFEQSMESVTGAITLKVVGTKMLVLTAG